MKLTKQRLMTATIGLFTVITLAAPATALANDNLKAIMKKMGRDYKALGPQISDSSKNTSSVSLASDISAQLVKAHDEVPDSVDQLNGAERDAALSEFQNQINDAKAQVDQLMTALQNGDNNTAAAILNKVTELKKTGHDKFDPRP